MLGTSSWSEKMLEEELLAAVIAEEAQKGGFPNGKNCVLDIVML